MNDLGIKKRKEKKGYFLEPPFLFCNPSKWMARISYICPNGAAQVVLTQASCLPMSPVHVCMQSHSISLHDHSVAFIEPLLCYILMLHGILQCAALSIIANNGVQSHNHNTHGKSSLIYPNHRRSTHGTCYDSE